jgi:hypothetical protein
MARDVCAWTGVGVGAFVAFGWAGVWTVAALTLVALIVFRKLGL